MVIVIVSFFPVFLSFYFGFFFPPPKLQKGFGGQAHARPRAKKHLRVVPHLIRLHMQHWVFSRRSRYENIALVHILLTLSFVCALCAPADGICTSAKPARFARLIFSLLIGLRQAKVVYGIHGNRCIHGGTTV